MKKWIIGIDEAGRGPLAGPVSVGVCCFEYKVYKKYIQQKNRLPIGVDSKKLSEERREAWFGEIEKMKTGGVLRYAVGFSSTQMIDAKGLTFAIRSAMKKALKEIEVDPIESKVLLDGGLKPPKEFTDFQTIIKGDEKEAVIGLASICAKVLRDRRMQKLAKKYPAYGFEIHKGYGTKKHREQIRLCGILKEHRKSFLKRLFP